MRQRKRTYSLPTATVARFEREVRPGRRSRVVAEIMEQWVAEREREELREGIIEGCKEMADTYLEIEKEFHPLEEEAGHAL